MNSHGQKKKFLKCQLQQKKQDVMVASWACGSRPYERFWDGGGGAKNIFLDHTYI